MKEIYQISKFPPLPEIKTFALLNTQTKEAIHITFRRERLLQQTDETPTAGIQYQKMHLHALPLGRTERDAAVQTQF